MYMTAFLFVRKYHNATFITLIVIKYLNTFIALNWNLEVQERYTYFITSL